MRKPKYLTVEFAGICMLVKEKHHSHAEVRLIDVWNAMKAGDEGRSRHFATLLVNAAGASAEGDFAVAVPDDRKQREYVGWNIAGKNIAIQTDLKQAKVRIATRYMANLTELCATGTTKPQLKRNVPLASTVRIPGGAIAAIAPPKGWPKIRFTAPGAQKAAVTGRFAARFRVRIPFSKSATVTVGGQKLTFKTSASLLIGNMCREVGAKKRHFYAYYQALQNHQRMTLTTAGREAGALGQFGDWPWLCIFSAFIE